MTITAVHLAQHIETDLPAGALERLLNDALAAVAHRAGPIGEQMIRMSGTDRFLFLPYPIAAAADIDSITEIIDGVETVLDPADYLWWGGRQIERLVTGPNARSAWWHHVLVTVTPTADEARRDRVTIDLVRLAVQHTGLAGETAGDYSSKAAEYQKERERILLEITPRIVA